MANILNVGIMQNRFDMYYQDSIERICKEVENLMGSMNTPDIIVGTEMGGGMFWDPERKLDGKLPPVGAKHDTIPGMVCNAYSKIAQKYKIYFIPGSMQEVAEEYGEIKIYNTIPIFGPDGSLIDKYRKMCPYFPPEGGTTPGNRYVVFDIPEKNTTIGIMNCHDWCFPEIARNLALMGAEVILRPAVDPEGLYKTCKTIAPTRAFENQAYFLSLNMVGEFMGSYSYGRSMLAGPDGHIIYEAGTNEVSLSLALDLDAVKNARIYGTNFTEQLLRQLSVFHFPMPYANDMSSAPIVKKLPRADLSPQSRLEKFIDARLIQKR